MGSDWTKQLSRNPPRELAVREACLGLHSPGTLVIPCDPDPSATPRWYDESPTPVPLNRSTDTGTRMREVTHGNEVLYLVGGQETFQAMVDAIRTTFQPGAKNYFIYMLNWFLRDDFPLIPSDPSSLLLGPTGEAQLWAHVSPRPLLKHAEACNVQIRAMLYFNLPESGKGGIAKGEVGSTVGNIVNAEPCRRINKLSTGAAILDRRVLDCASHHQKIMVVNGNEGLIGFCGGLDFNPDRLWEVDKGYNVQAEKEKHRLGTTTEGAPLQDVHCRIRGRGALELLKIVHQRWDDYLEYVLLDPDSPVRKPGDLASQLHGNAQPQPMIPLGERTGAVDRNHVQPQRSDTPGFKPERLLPLTAIVGQRQQGHQFVQIGCTFGNGVKHPGIGCRTVKVPYSRDQQHAYNTGYSFAAHGERTAWRMIVKAIAEARHFIYVEDQFCCDPDPTNGSVRDVLLATLAQPSFQHLTILIPADRITPMEVPPLGSQTAYRRHQFLTPLQAKWPGKVRVFFLRHPGTANTYVHSKTWIFDDEYAIIGSTNCSRRDFTHDSQAGAGICDEPGVGFGLGFAHRLRMALWAKHLSMKEAELEDGIASAAHWLDPPDQARIDRYYPKQVEPRAGWDTAWDQVADPDGS